MRTLTITLLIGMLGVVVAADPPSPKPADPTRGKPNLVPNGDFEEGEITPKHWQTIDGLSTFWVKDDDPQRGKVIRVDTDILQSQAYGWWTKIAKGAAPKDAPAKLPTKEPKYDTLAGLDGVWFWSDFIPIEKDKAYWLTVDARGPSGGMLAWLVGYPKKRSIAFGSESGAFQEAFKQRVTGQPPDRRRNFDPFIHQYVWKGQLSSLAGTSPTQWRTFSRRQQPFRPTANTPEVRFVRVMVYAFWPPGVYSFDNVRLVEVEDNGVGKP